jgi:hypothetical protein
MAKKRNRTSVVKQGGIAREPSNTEDVTRDTYGDSQPNPVRDDPDERIAEADRAAAAVGIPGVAVPEPETVAETAEAQGRDDQVRQTNISGDRVASRGDSEKLRSKRS